MSSVRKPCLLAARSHPAGKRLFVLPLLVAGRGLEAQPSQVLQTLEKAEAHRRGMGREGGMEGWERKRERKTTMADFSSNAAVRLLFLRLFPLRFFFPHWIVAGGKWLPRDSSGDAGDAVMPAPLNDTD